MIVRHSSSFLTADPKKVILQFFNVGNEKRTMNVIERILKLSEEEVEKLSEEINTEFENRHLNFQNQVISNYEKIKSKIPVGLKLSDQRKFVLGSYFSKEYSVESAALFNPSIVPFPGKEKEGKFILSLRSTGEGHMSSIEFRSGTISGNEEILVDSTSRFLTTGKRIVPNRWKKSEIKNISQHCGQFSEKEFSGIPEEVTIEELKNILKSRITPSWELVTSYLESYYTVEFSGNEEIDERILFPFSSSESVGMEDVRWVRFENEDHSIIYYGTYTAYNGKTFRVQLISTADFKKFEVSPLFGDAVKDKGMAIFPRKINGKYVITSRLDGENLYVMESDDLHVWNHAKMIYEPELPWEFVQLGNCGSPIETKDGWLLITHSVGAFRKYVISAYLLDLNDPSKIIGRLPEPLISPNENEREGYVPNVVYSCGCMNHNGNLIIPYAMSDSKTSFATVSINSILKKIKSTSFQGK